MDARLAGRILLGRDPPGALARVPSAVSRFVEWLTGHDEPLPAPPLDLQIIEEVAAYCVDGGYEVNATFAADDRQISVTEREREVRRLGYARADLIALVDRLRAFEAGGGRLAQEQRPEAALASGASDGRDVDDVLRHIAGAEAWFVSRLDPQARYEGPRGDLAVYLAASREFLVEGLGRLHAQHPALARTDGKGERWTLAKLLRRALYHSLDHLDELDRRLALAEKRADRVELRRNAQLDVAELRRLFAAAGLAQRARDSDDLNARMLAGSTETVGAWDGERLVGFARIISDEATNAYISTVAVAPRWQGRGLGRRLMNALMDGREALKLTLDVRDGAESFYGRLGFRPVQTVLVRPRGGQR